MSSNLKDISNAIADVIGESIDTAIDSAVESYLESTKAYRSIESAIETVIEGYDFSDIIDEDLVTSNVDISSMVESEIESQVESKVEGILADKAEEWTASLESNSRATEWNMDQTKRLELRISDLEFALESIQAQKVDTLLARLKRWFKAKFRANTAKLPIA
jgi:hypothetical protein